MSRKCQSLGGSSNPNHVIVKLSIFAVLVIICRTIDSRNIEETNSTNVKSVTAHSNGGPRLNLTNDYIVDGKNASDLSTTRFKRRLKSPSNVLPEFSAPIGNVTAVLGRDVRLVCTVENLGHYQVSKRCLFGSSGSSSRIWLCLERAAYQPCDHRDHRASAAGRDTIKCGKI